MKKKNILKILSFSSLILFSSAIFACNDNNPSINSESKTGTISLVFDSSKGNVNSSIKEGKVGDTVTLSISPNEGYEVEYVEVNGTKISGNSYSFSLIEGENRVVVSFVEATSKGTVALVFDSSKGNVTSSIKEGKVGDIVTLSISPNEGYETQSVKANGEELSGNSYSFSLIKGENRVEVTFKEKEADTYKIINDSSKYASIEGLPNSSVKVGTTISFTAKISVTYYTFLDVSVFSYGTNFVEEIIEVINNNGTYSFIMPNKDVHVRVNYTVNSYKINFDNSNLISYVKKLEAGEEYSTNVYNGDSVKYGSTITVGLRSYSTDRLTVPSGFKLIYNGETHTISKENDKTEYTFSMPEYDVTIEEISSPYQRDITLNNSTNLSLTLFKKENGNYVETKTGIKDETLYLKVDGTTSSISVKEISMSYIKYSYSTTYETTTNEIIYNTNNTTSLNSDGYYEFIMPDMQHDNTLSITITEKNLSIFLNYDFIGTYKGLSLYNSDALGTITSFKNADNLVIDSSGLMVKGSDNNVDEYQISSATTSFATIKEGEQGFAYTDKCIYSSSGDFSMKSQNSVGSSSDFYFKIEEGTSESDYTVYAELFVYNKVTYQVATVYYQNSLYTNCVVDSSSNYYFDLDLEFISGEHVTDDNASYYIKNNNELLYYVGIDDDGVGRNHRVILEKHGKLTLTSSNDSSKTLYLNGLGYCNYEGSEEEYNYSFNSNDTLLTLTKDNWEIVLNIDLNTLSYTRTVGNEVGTYSGENGSLVLDGLGNATYNNISYTYSFTATNIITLHEGDDKTNIVLDLNNKTYETSSLPKFAGHAYKGSYYDAWDEATDYIYIEFSSTDLTCGLKGGYSSSIDLTSSMYTFFIGTPDEAGNHYVTYDSYSYDESTSTLSFTMRSQSQSAKDMTMTYNESKDTLTINENYQSNMYNTKGTKLSRI